MTELSQTSADCNPRATSSLRYTTLFALCPCSTKNIWGRLIDLSAKKLQSSWSIMRRISASCSGYSSARRKNQSFGSSFYIAFLAPSTCTGQSLLSADLEGLEQQFPARSGFLSMCSCHGRSGPKGSNGYGKDRIPTP